MASTTPDKHTESAPACAPYFPAKSSEERLASLRALRGMWKGRDPDPVAYFESLRQEPDRELPERRG